MPTRGNNQQREKRKLVIDQIVEIMQESENRRKGIEKAIRMIGLAHQEIQEILNDDRENQEEGYNLLTRNYWEFNVRTRVLTDIRIELEPMIQVRGREFLSDGVVDQFYNAEHKLYSMLYTKVLPLFTLEEMIAIVRNQIDTRPEFLIGRYCDVAIILMTEKMELLPESESERREQVTRDLWNAMKGHFPTDYLINIYMRNGGGKYVLPELINKEAQFIKSMKDGSNSEKGRKMYNEFICEMERGVHSMKCGIYIHRSFFYYVMYHLGKGERKGYTAFCVEEIMIMIRVLRDLVNDMIQQESRYLRRYGVSINVDAVKFIVYMIEMIDDSFIVIARKSPQTPSDPRKSNNQTYAYRVIDSMDTLMKKIRKLGTYNSLEQMLHPYVERWRIMAQLNIDVGEERFHYYAL
mgnify:CR=1 FL=1